MAAPSGAYPRFVDWSARLKIGLPLLAAFVLFVIAVDALGIDTDRIARGWREGARFLDRAFPPNMDTAIRLWGPAIDTIQIGIVGTALGIVLSLILGALAAKNLTPHPIIGFTLKTLFGLTRAIPALVWALLFIVAVGLGSLPGILAIGVNSIGMLGKIFAETFEEVDRGVIDALRSTGAGWWQVLVQGVVPETLPRLISWSIFRLDINIRYSSVLGIVGAGGIGWELARAARMGDYPAAVTVTLVIFLVVYAMELITTRLRKLVV